MKKCENGLAVSKKVSTFALANEKQQLTFLKFSNNEKHLS